MITPVALRSTSLVHSQVERLRRNLQTQLALADPDPGQIHDIRLCCKKLRSCIRLLRHKGDASHWQQADSALRLVSRQFAPARDAEVLQHTMHMLHNSTRSNPCRAACLQVLQALQHSRPAAKVKGKTRPTSKDVPQLLADTKLTEKAMGKGMLLTQRRCLRLACKAFEGHTTTESLHRLRRWVKYLGYQFGLAALPTPANVKTRQQLAVLGRTLGHIHDLVLLQQQLGALNLVDRSAAALVAVQANRLSQRLIAQADLATRALFEI